MKSLLKKSPSPTFRFHIFGAVVFGALIIGSVLSVSFFSHHANARVSGWDAGNIIDDSVFTNTTTMTAAQIQNFLNSKVTSCDTNGQQLSEYGGPDLNGDGKVQRWEWGKANYNQTTFKCLRDYVVSDGRTAAQVIYDTAQKYTINPQVLLVLLQKEQGLVLDTWPLDIQYRSATGYGCPDTAPCDSQYYGLINQLDWAAKMFRAILNNSPTWYTPYILGNNYVQYSPDSSCGGSNVNILNRSTQALYNYTPYQPNDAALNADWGTVACGAYGNRNFYLYFTSWFGTTHGPAYAWQELSQKIYTSDTKAVELDRTNVGQGQYMYIEYIVKNTGYKTWAKNSVLLGRGSNSPFCTNEWIACSRATSVNKTQDVAPGETVTFGFWMRAPLVTGFYKVYWNLLIENVSWFVDIGSNHSMTVTAKKVSDHLTTSNDYMKLGDTLTSPDGASTLFMASNGTLSIYYKGANVQTLASSVYQLRQQGDGNLVAYSRSGTPLWSIGDGTPRELYITNEGKLVYKKDTADPGLLAASWPTTTSDRGEEIKADQILLQNQVIYSNNKQYHLVLQNDGNLVQYGPSGPIWATGQNRGHFLIQQGDGKIVLYDYKGSAIWASPVWVPNGQASRTVIQGDSNLVTYNGYSPIWSATR